MTTENNTSDLSYLPEYNLDFVYRLTQNAKELTHVSKLPVPEDYLYQFGHIAYSVTECEIPENVPVGVNVLKQKGYRVQQFRKLKTPFKGKTTVVFSENTIPVDSFQILYGENLFAKDDPDGARYLEDFTKNN
jgi:hypothetical protein